MKILTTLQKRLRALLCRHSDLFHGTHHPNEHEMLCHHCKARWSKITDMPGQWLRVSDVKPESNSKQSDRPAP